MIVAVWGDTPESAVDLKCFLDGRDDYWVTSTTVGAPDLDAVGQAAKAAACLKNDPSRKAEAIER
jgi:hypothetical protein